MKHFRFFLPTVVCATLFLLYGFTLTTCTLFIIGCIISVAFLVKGSDDEYKEDFIALGSYVFLLLGGIVSLITLYNLYNPSKEVFTNAEHHILSFVGYETDKDNVLLFGNSKDKPIWSNEELGGEVRIHKQGDSVEVEYKNLLQPLYQKVESKKYHERLLNAQSLPAFNTEFTITLKNNLGLKVIINDEQREDRFLEPLANKIKPLRSDSCVVKVEFLKDGAPVSDTYTCAYTNLIKRSLPLNDIINDAPLPSELDFDWSVTKGITVLREKPAKKNEFVEKDHFRLAFTPAAIGAIKELEINDETYTSQELIQQAQGRCVIEKDLCNIGLRIGSGMDATPYVRPYRENGKLFVKMDAPQRQYLPMERDSLEHPQSFVVTSSLEGLASSRTVSALHYPVLKCLDEDEQFNIAVEYLPEHTSVPLVCKAQTLSKDKLMIQRGGGVVETDKLTAGDRLTLKSDKRELTPVFTLQNLRNWKAEDGIPFTSQHGYWMILTALICAGFSIFAGRGRFEVRGEVIVWLGLIALLTFRAFIAWRTSVFPPLDGFSIARWIEYQNSSYTFTLTILCIVALSLVWSLYKWFKPEFCYRWLERASAWCLPLLTLVIVGVLGGICYFAVSERFTYVYCPVLSFILMEWIYQHKRHDGETDFRWDCLRYISMLIALAVPLVTDAGFGIVFALFLFIYNALENYYQAQNAFYETGKVMNVHTILMFVFLGLFIIFMFFGIHVLSFMFSNFVVFAIGFVLVMAVLGYLYYRKAVQVCAEESLSKSWIYIPLGGIALIALLFVGLGKGYLDGHKHLLYRAEVHLKPVETIMMENEVDSRDLERLFQASQNRWYLGYYMEDRGWEKAVPFDYKPYDLRSHFNKGITWDTQKTDAVLGRYVMGEHSSMTVYALIALFLTIFVGIYIVNRRQERYRLLGTGLTLLLACQAIFITLAVTNRFIFFGQDYPLISQHTILTLALTFTAFMVIGLSSQREEIADDLDDEDRRISLQLVGLLAVLFVFALLPGRTLHTESGKAFNVANALQRAKSELAAINNMLEQFQESFHEEIAEEKMLVNFKTEEERIAEEKKKVKNYKPKQLQTNYHQFINYFDGTYALADTLIRRAKNKAPGISPFTASLYKIYRDKLAKNNRSTDIIHLKTKSNGRVEFGINNGFYLLTTPENTIKAWKGNIIPQENVAKQSMLTVQGDKGKMTIPIQTGSSRLDNMPELTYDYPMYLAKVDNNWIPDGRDYFIVGDAAQPTVVKNGIRQYQIKKADNVAHYMAVQADDYIEMTGKKRTSEKNGRFYIKGDQGRYFARNILVNGKRMMIYPLGEKFFYPYHLNQMATEALSGDNKEKQNRDVRLSLSYTLTEELFDDLNDFTSSARGQYTDARSLIVADGNGHIKALVTTKNEKRNSGFEYIDPNDEITIGKKANQYYLSGDTKAEERGFGELNFTYLNPGPGSSIKPLTFTSVMSQACYDWRKLQLYINTIDQKLTVKGDEIYTKYYTDIVRGFPSLYGDEKGKDGYTDIALYMQQSSNYFNSLMVFFGFYDGNYLTNELDNIAHGKKSELFKTYSRSNQEDSYNFPAFTLTENKNRLFNFRTWVTKDGKPRHKDGALQVGFKKNFGLWSDLPSSLSDEEYNRSIDIYKNTELFNVEELNRTYAFAFPQVSYLPEDERITFQGTKDAIRNTTLGAYPFHVTPLKMAEMFGKLFSQNREYSLTLNPDYVQEYEAFERSEAYDEQEELYEDILSNHLFRGMARVVTDGTGKGLAATASKLKNAGYGVYAKTGTISNGEGNPQSQLLAVVITKGKMDGLDADEFNAKSADGRFYVLYFLTEKQKHDYNVINNALTTVCNSGEFQRYMNEGDNKKEEKR